MFAITILSKNNNAQKCYVWFLHLFRICSASAPAVSLLTVSQYEQNPQDPPLPIKIVISSQTPEFPWKEFLKLSEIISMIINTFLWKAKETFDLLKKHIKLF